MVLYCLEFDQTKACLLIRSLSQKVCQSGPTFGTFLLYLNAMGILSICQIQQLTSEWAVRDAFHKTALYTVSVRAQIYITQNNKNVN